MRRTVLPITVLAAALVTHAFSAFTTGAPPPASADAERRTPVVRAVEKAAPAVVSISTERLVRSDPFFDDWFGRFGSPRSVRGVGSGVIVHPDGYVVTNFHVVRRATEIIVEFEESGRQRQYPATILGEDEGNDLALLKIEGERPFPHASLGKSDDLMIGEPVLALGNPFGVGRSVMTGVISATGRTVRTAESKREFRDFIQTDAAINPGNSGGPLVNIHGDMIGVNTAIVRGAEGLGFAIPVDRVKANLARLITEAVRRANLGFLPVSEAGRVYVRSLDEKGVAAAGGLRSEDVIEKVEGRAVRSIFDFATPLLSKKPGDLIRVDFLRSGSRLSLDLTMPLSPEASTVSRRLGLVGRDVSPADRKRGWSGVVVEKVLPQSPAAKVKMQPGDLIQSIEGIRLDDLRDLAALLDRVRPGVTIDVEVVRRGRAMVGSVVLK